MAIVYQHRRLDNGEVFYVGIGSKDTRAYYNRSRNIHWHNIANKHGYSVEITHRDLCWEEACSIEQYLISFYGRRDLNEGSLVNMTSGGEGANNLSEETIKKRVANTNFKDPARIAKLQSPEAKIKRKKTTNNFQHLRTPEIRKKAVANTDWSFTADPGYIKRRVANTDYAARSANTDYSYLKNPELIAKRIANTDRSKIDTPEAHAKQAAKIKIPILQYTISGDFIREWSSASDAGISLKIDSSSISKCCKNKAPSAGNYLWRYQDPEKWFPPVYINRFGSKEMIERAVSNRDYKSIALKNSKAIFQYSKDDVFIKEWISITEAGKKLNIHIGSIAECCKGNVNTAGKFKWRYKIII